MRQQKCLLNIYIEQKKYHKEKLQAAAAGKGRRKGYKIDAVRVRERVSERKSISLLREVSCFAPCSRRCRC